MDSVIKIAISGLSVYIAAWLLPGVRIEGIIKAIIVAVCIAIANYTVRPLLIVLTLPITILTLGLFLFVINALMVMLVAYLIKGFEVNGFLNAILFSLALSLISILLEIIFRK